LLVLDQIPNPAAQALSSSALVSAGNRFLSFNSAPRQEPKYIKNGTETYGYFSGAYFSSQLGLTTQMPSVIEIVTDKEATKGRTITVGSQNVRLRYPAIQITKENALLLQFLDAVSTAEKYAEFPQQEMTALLKQYLCKHSFTRKQLAEALPSVTAQTAKKLIEWELIYEFS